MASKPDERVIVLVDMDCFYVQVEQKLCPKYFGKPCAVVQYNTWKGGGIIAVNYEARARGVTRMLRGDEAQKLCPDIHLFRVPEVRGKADLTKYREAGAKVLDVLCEYCDCVERASIDEAYLDMTAVINAKLQSSVSCDQIPNTYVVGWGDEEETRKTEVAKWLQMIHEEDHLYNDKMLAIAAVITEEMRAAVFSKTGYRCSAGIAHNKMLSKLSCGLHKPNKQTVLPQASIQLLYSTIPINKVRNLGGKLGKEVTEKFNAKTMGELFNVSKSQFVGSFGEKTGSWLYNLARGIENEPVIARQLPKSVGCGKNFPGKKSLSTKDEVMHWLTQLCTELEERLTKDKENNQRIARLLTISVRNKGNEGFTAISRSCPIYVYNSQKLTQDAFNAIQKLNIGSNSSWEPAICSLAISASKFEDDISTGTSDIQSYFFNKTPTKAPFNAEKKSINIETENISHNCKNVEDKVLNCEQMEKAKMNITSFFSPLAHSSKNTDFGGNVCAVDSELRSKDANKSDDSIQSINTDDIMNERPNTAISAQQNLQMDKPETVKGFFAKKLAEMKMSTPEKSATTVKSNNCSSANACSEEDSVKCDVSSQNGFLADFSCVPSTSKDQYSELDPELTKMCSKCNKKIPIWEEEEHMDYHIALDLSKEFRTQSVGKINIPSKSHVSSMSRKGSKRGAKSKFPLPKKKSMQYTLDSFISNEK
ncbi:DNA polymerase eta-like [Uloborus diversus]|uniref:DNA polymerase eta-like n=1 Tax=Uloborus diversus TaxID=327109 RepID=UPI0024091E6C|nr:DNA polymerase eta-like [Uloborus diversus]